MPIFSLLISPKDLEIFLLMYDLQNVPLPLIITYNFDKKL